MALRIMISPGCRVTTFARQAGHRSTSTGPAPGKRSMAANYTFSIGIVKNDLSGWIREHLRSA
jgi:hypothetical protein